MIPAIGQPEEINRVAPLGVRFCDAISGQPVSDGLSVTAYPLQKPNRRTAAFTNRSGIYVFQDLPGIRDREFGVGDKAYWSLVHKTPFEVEVIDLLGRFQAFTFQVDLPSRDLFTDACFPGSPVSEPIAGVPLYSTVTRRIPSGMAVIYATLQDALHGRPAPWCFVEASLDGEVLARGFADREGRIALLFPYPQLSHAFLSPPGSPAQGNHLPLLDQSWSIHLRAFYTPWDPRPVIPDICRVFRQEPVRLMETLSPQAPLTDVLLHFGEQLVITWPGQSFVLVLP